MCVGVSLACGVAMVRFEGMSGSKAASFIEAGLGGMSGPKASSSIVAVLGVRKAMGYVKYIICVV